VLVIETLCEFSIAKSYLKLCHFFLTSSEVCTNDTKRSKILRLTFLKFHYLFHTFCFILGQEQPNGQYLQLLKVQQALFVKNFKSRDKELETEVQHPSQPRRDLSSSKSKLRQTKTDLKTGLEIETES